jgi:hypothetical protein
METRGFFFGSVLLSHGTRMEEAESRHVGVFVQISWRWKRTLKSDRSYLIQQGQQKFADLQEVVRFHMIRSGVNRDETINQAIL